MENILDYIRWRGDLTVEQVPFNEVDSLIFVRLAYLPFDEIALSEKDEISVGEAAKRILQVPEIGSKVLWKYDVDLLNALQTNERFRNMRLTRYVNRVERETETQFSAVTIKIGDDLSFISFRGTDNTIIGWKEDLNMSFIFPVPAQESAVRYLESVAEILPGNIILGGHSKGGNLAVYASAFCSKELQRRIVAAYNFDGPGFNEQILSTPQYKGISEKAITFVPQSSVVGMLLEHEEDYTIVKSDQKNGLLQHDIYSWEVKRDSLNRMDSITNSSKFIDHTLRGWVADMDVEQRERFIDGLYEVISETNVKTLRELGGSWFENAGSILLSIRNLDDSTRRVIFQSLGLLAKNAKDSIKELY